MQKEERPSDFETPSSSSSITPPNTRVTSRPYQQRTCGVKGATSATRCVTSAPESARGEIARFVAGPWREMRFPSATNRRPERQCVLWGEERRSGHREKHEQHEAGPVHVHRAGPSHRKQTVPRLQLASVSSDPALLHAARERSGQSVDYRTGAKASTSRSCVAKHFCTWSISDRNRPYANSGRSWRHRRQNR